MGQISEYFYLKGQEFSLESWGPLKHKLWSSRTMDSNPEPLVYAYSSLGEVIFGRQLTAFNGL